MQINWKVRLMSKQFWLGMIPLIFLLIGEIWGFFGSTPDFTPIVERLIRIVKLVFLILGLLGVVTDPTTEGISDSKQALTYNAPKPKGV